ncbi:hypothetical protein F5I97DRAFT_425464 [Phlebopus sp. FC_14]|nr:hypothetical protein F5I97DRAFT_425464 [Phlebopus sp. FC_14]
MSSDDDIEVSDVRSGACSSTGNIGTSSHPGSTADGSRHTKLPVASRSGSKLAHIRLPSSTEEESSEQEAADTLQASRKSRPKDKAASGKSKFKPAPHTFPMPSPPRNALSSITTDEFTTSHHPASPPLQVPSSSRHPEESTDNALNPSSPKPPSRVDDESRNNSLPKYFRKSTFHTSPRHVRRGPALLNSPTSPSTALDWPDRKAILSSTAQVIREPGAIQWTSSSTSGYIARHKSESVIYISSDSEDDNAGDADTAIILSHPPALFPPHSLFTSTSASTIGKSKTNLSVASTAHTARTGSVAETTLKNAPLLAARAKASTDDTVGRTGLFLGSKPISMNSRAKIPVSSQDIIDLT